MTLRIGFDMDGVLADFASAFRDVEARLFESAQDEAGDAPVKPEAAEASLNTGVRRVAAPGVGDLYRRREAVWQQITATPDFWTTLRPLEQGGVRRLHDMMLQHGWEVVFITQRPATEGETVQRQTQRWLIAQGFDMPSVVVISGSRGRAAGALRLNYHVDDDTQHCVDVLAHSKAKPLLVARADDAQTRREAQKRGIGVAATIGECLDLLDKASNAKDDPRLFRRLAELIGWR
jgi:hypothetical protein